MEHYHHHHYYYYINNNNDDNNDDDDDNIFYTFFRIKIDDLQLSTRWQSAPRETFHPEAASDLASPQHQTIINHVWVKPAFSRLHSHVETLSPVGSSRANWTQLDVTLRC